MSKFIFVTNTGPESGLLSSYTRICFGILVHYNKHLGRRKKRTAKAKNREYKVEKVALKIQKSVLKNVSNVSVLWMESVVYYSRILFYLIDRL